MHFQASFISESRRDFLGRFISVRPFVAILKNRKITYSISFSIDPDSTSAMDKPRTE
jgi:hypothetical protein